MGNRSSPAAAGISVSQTIPADFPSDVPIMPEAKLGEVRKMRGTFSVDMSVNQAPVSVVHYYESELARQGWFVARFTDEDKEDDNEDGVSATKNGHRTVVSLYGSDSSSSDLKLIVH